MRHNNTSWTKQKDSREDGVYFSGNKVNFYTSYQGGKDASGSDCTLYEFLRGQGNVFENIKSTFGDVLLEEMIEAAQAFLNSAEHVNYLRSNQNHLDFINKIPFVPELKEMFDRTSCDDEGSYCNINDWCSPDGYQIHSATQLISDNSSMEYAYSNDGSFYIFRKNKQGAKKCMPSHVIGSLEYGLAYKDSYYCCFGQSFIVITKTGEFIADTEDQVYFGSTLRINRVRRKGDNVCFFYDWFSREHPSGLLRFDLVTKKFNGRCSE